MNKDAILASIIGFGIGLLITAGVIMGPRVLSQWKQSHSGTVASATTEQKSETTITPSPATTSNQGLTIDTPTKDTIVHDNTTQISGKAPKRATVIVGSTEDESVIETKDSTEYKATVPLKEGKNDISVVSVVDGKSTIERVTIYYTPNK